MSLNVDDIHLVDTSYNHKHSLNGLPIGSIGSASEVFFLQVVQVVQVVNRVTNDFLDDNSRCGCFSKELTSCR